MSNFLINHFARSVVKATRSQPKPKSKIPQSNYEQDQWLIAQKAIGLGVLLLSIIAGVIGILLVVIFR